MARTELQLKPEEPNLPPCSYDLLHDLQGHDNSVSAVAFNRDGSLLASSSADCSLCLWDVSSGNLVHKMTGHHAVRGETRSTVCTSDMERSPLLLCDASVRPAIHAPIQVLDSLQGVSDVCWDSTSRYLCSCSDDTTIKVWDAASGRCIKTFFGHTNFVFCAAFNPQAGLGSSVHDIVSLC